MLRGIEKKYENASASLQGSPRTSQQLSQHFGKTEVEIGVSRNLHTSADAV